MQRAIGELCEIDGVEFPGVGAGNLFQVCEYLLIVDWSFAARNYARVLVAEKEAILALYPGASSALAPRINMIADML